MNVHAKIEIGHSVCPHDCPSTCALDVEVLADGTIGRVHGAEDNDYTAGVICAKVARYAERIHHPDRLMHPLQRTGPKGSGEFERISWDDALDLIAEAMLTAERRYGPEAVWPYYYAGTMGLVMRDGINRLRHAKRYSGMYATICTTLAWTGYIAGTGRLAGPDPREMAKSDLVVIWGTNAVNTQVNVMTHATRARKERGAKIVVIDIYRNATMQQADLGALPAAGHRRRARLRRDARAVPRRPRRPRLSREATPTARASSRRISPSRTPGMGRRDHGSLGRRDRGLRPARRHHAQRPTSGSATASPASATARPTCTRRSCIPASPAPGSTRAAARFHNNGAIYHWDKTLIEGLDVARPAACACSTSRGSARC